MELTARYGLEFNPFLKNSKEILFEGSEYKEAKFRLDYLARTKGFGLLTGAPGRGKTTLVRSWSTGLNPSLYKVIYTSLSTVTVNDFSGTSPHPWVHSHPTGRPKTFTSFRRRSIALTWIKRRLRLSSLMKRTISKMLFLTT